MRQRIEDKEKIAPGWFEEKDEYILFFKIVLVQNSLRRKELNKLCPSNSSDDLCLFLCICPPFMGFSGKQKYEEY